MFKDFSMVTIIALPLTTSAAVPTQARSGDPGQGGAVSMGPVWHACIAKRPAKHGASSAGLQKVTVTRISKIIFY